MERAFRKCQSCGYLYYFIRAVMQKNGLVDRKCPKCGGQVERLFEEDIEEGTLVPGHRNIT